ncbi:MAG: glycoside hydrolase family 88 protein [Beutenbergiaceae bacterium]
MNGVAWGAERYSAVSHAATALRTTRRAGASALHEDSEAVVRIVADALIQLQFKTWDFGDSVAFEALLAASAGLGDARWERFAHGWGRAWATRSRPFARLDCTVPGRALTLIAERHDDEQLLAELSALAGYLRERRTLDGVYETWDASPLLTPYGDAGAGARDLRLLADPPAGVFVDCLHFDPPFFAALGRVAGDGELVDDALRQALGYLRLLQREDGLFDHFALRSETESFGPGWGRGQGWAALGLLETIIELRTRRESGGDGRFDAGEAALAGAVARQLERMAALQRADGHWEVVVDRPGSGDEYSTAGFMAHAMHEAVRLGIGDVAVLTASARSARTAILRSLDADGQLREVSAAVYASTVPDHYLAVPRGYVVPWGQGPALLALLASS